MLYIPVGRALETLFFKKGETMFHTAMTITKWLSIPILLVASMFSVYAASYELLVNMTVCLGSVVLVQHGMRAREYFWAAGFVTVAIVFSPLLLVVKIFLLMGFSCVVTVTTLVAAFRAQPVLAWHSEGKES